MFLSGKILSKNVVKLYFKNRKLMTKYDSTEPVEIGEERKGEILKFVRGNI